MRSTGRALSNGVMLRASVAAAAGSAGGVRAGATLGAGAGVVLGAGRAVAVGALALGAWAALAALGAGAGRLAVFSGGGLGDNAAAGCVLGSSCGGSANRV